MEEVNATPVAATPAPPVVSAEPAAEPIVSAPVVEVPAPVAEAAVSAAAAEAPVTQEPAAQAGETPAPEHYLTLSLVDDLAARVGALEHNAKIDVEGAVKSIEERFAELEQSLKDHVTALETKTKAAFHTIGADVRKLF